MKILWIFAEPLSNGGQESFALNIIKNINSNLIFDYFTPYYCDNEFIKKEVEIHGGKVYVGNKDFESKKRKKFFVQELKKFLQNYKYDIVHINSGSTFALAMGAEISKRNGVKTVIVHSHCAAKLGLKQKILNMFLKNKFLKNTDKYLACSEITARVKFPKEIINEKKYTIIKNGIDVDKFKYDEEIRREYRENLNLEGSFVLGHVGRFETEKNQKFIVEVFENLLKIKENSKLILVGNGTLLNKIRRLIEKKNLTDKVIILSKRNDVNKIIQAFDFFIFPSLYEGLGIVAIESQTAGLKTICSENIPNEANITPDFIRCSLNEPAEYWASEIARLSNYNRNDNSALIRKEGYDAKKSAEKLSNEIYFEHKIRS